MRAFEEPRWYTSDTGNGAQVAVSVAKVPFSGLAAVCVDFCELHRTLRQGR